jgi:hypothetical protein
MPDRDDRLRVGYLGGTGRSGSTLLELILGSLPGFVAVGELYAIWSEGVVLNHRCGCGEAFDACPFWTAIGDRAFGGWSTLDAEALARLQPPAVGRLRQLPGLASRRLRGPELATALAHYGETMATLYEAIAHVGEARVVIDASKSGGHAFLLSEVPRIDPRVVHLVRDPRGVAYSWTRRIVRPDVPGGAAVLGPRSISRTDREWLLQNLAPHFLRVFSIPRMLTRYEDLIAEPAPALARILRFLGEGALAGEIAERVRGNEFEVTPNHAIAGNPLRFEYGRMPIKADDQWRDALPPRTQRLVLLQTLPLAARYGYLHRTPTR